MTKKIVVITSSPRKNGNTFAMTDAFIQAAQAKGHNVKRFDSAFMNITGCRACEACYKTGKPCAFNDDFNLIVPAIQDADGIVFTAPVYWFTMPAQLKAVIDKFFAFYTAQMDLSGKEYAIISSAEFTDTSIMDGLKLPIDKTAEALGWRKVGEVLVTGVLDAGAVCSTDGCQKAAALADKF